MNEIDSFSKKLEKVNSTLAMFLCAKIMTVTILPHLLCFFTLSQQEMFLLRKKNIGTNQHFFLSNLVYSMYNSRFFIFRKIFSHHSNSSCQWKEFFLSCAMPEGRRTYYTEKKRNYWDDIFIWKSFCRNVEINAIDLTAVVDSIIDFFPQSYSQM